MWITDKIKQAWRGLISFVARCWSMARPFVSAVLSQTASEFWNKSQELLMDAVNYVAQQGLPTDDAKRDAFQSYMKNKAKASWSDLSTLEQNLLREMALAIYKKIANKG